MTLLALLLVGCAGEPLPMLAAAASLREVVPELVAASGEELAVTYGGSGTLRMQVEAGAPVDGVLLASREPVEALVEAGHVVEPRVVATNRLVLVASEPSTLTFEALGQAERVAIGDPRSVPAGAYAEVVLRAAGSWEALQGRLVHGGDVSMVLAYARRGEVDAAVVYETDVRGIGDVVVLDRADTPRAEVVGALAPDAAPAVVRFLDFVVAPEGRAILGAHGFGLPSPSGGAGLAPALQHSP